MLSDNAEKSKNPLKKAMRRRNAKTVQFAPPTYVEASDYEFSSDEDESDGQDSSNKKVSEGNMDAGISTDQTETDTVEPLKINSKKDSKPEAIVSSEQELASGESNGSSRQSEETERPRKFLVRRGANGHSF